MRSLLVGLVFFFLVSCGEKTPDGIISQKQMPNILLDVHLADGQLSSMPIDSARAYLDSYYEAVFNRYGIDSATFERSVRYYASRPGIMNEFYNTIEKRLESINETEQQTMNVQYESRRTIDSIQRIRRLDSVNRVAKDSLDFLRKRHLLSLHSADSLYGEPVPVTHERLSKRLLEQLGLNSPGGAGVAKERGNTSDGKQASPPVSRTPTMGAPAIENRRTRQ